MRPDGPDKSHKVKTDTSAAIAEVQVSVLRGLSPLARLDLAVEMSVAARDLLRARLRERHPEWSQRTLDRAVLRHTLPEGRLPPALR